MTCIACGQMVLPGFSKAAEEAGKFIVLLDAKGEMGACLDTACVNTSFTDFTRARREALPPHPRH